MARAFHEPMEYAPTVRKIPLLAAIEEGHALYGESGRTSYDTFRQRDLQSGASIRKCCRVAHSYAVDQRKPDRLPTTYRARPHRHDEGSHA